MPDITAAHLHPSLAGLGIRGRFDCGGRHYMVTDIGTRTLLAVEITERDVQDPTWLAGPPFAVVEHVFDETDFEALEPIGGAES